MPKKPVHARPTSSPVSLNARLACGCVVGFAPGADGSPVTVVLIRKASTCLLSMHVPDLPVFDHREALRPSTRLSPSVHSDYEES